MHVKDFAQCCQQIVQKIGEIIIGKREVLEQILLGIVSNGHILIEDYPGLAKTLIAQLFAESTDLQFRRVQFTPDLLPGDLTGGYIYNQQKGTFEFRPGPLFTNLLLADEINRATPKTQAALLEAMQERQITIEGNRYPLSPPFIVIATQNPIEFEGTYPLPEAQLDRFLLKLSVGYPSPEEEQEILARRQQRRSDEVHIGQIVDHHTLLEMQQTVENIYVSKAIERYIVDLVSETRRNPKIEVGASPRGSLALFKLARARAALQVRDFVIPDDVKAVAVVGLSHRIIMKPELWVSRIPEETIIQQILDTVPTPKAE
ncbi:MAG: MoxR family ATPase [Nitrospinota bacterium]|nr:MAG: MoxR family ATPase [Nitrospinota bacterium]